MKDLTLQFMGASLANVGSTIVAVAVFAFLIEFALWLVFERLLHHRLALPIMLLTPAAIGPLMPTSYPG